MRLQSNVFKSYRLQALVCGLKASSHATLLQIVENYEFWIQGWKLPHMRDGKYANRTYLGEVRLKLQAAYFLVALDPQPLLASLLFIKSRPLIPLS